MIRSVPAVLAIVLLAACDGSPATDTSDDTRPPTPTTTVEPTTTAPPDYRGDPDSAFCREILQADSRPVLDPFEVGLAPDEIELRTRALVLRFERLATDAPPELADDLGEVGDALRRLDETLAASGYDLGAAAESGADLSALDDPRFADVAVRLAAYASQVCGRT